jgi:FkbM family methyltransferase
MTGYSMRVIKRVLQRSVKSIGLYERLKASLLYDAYWKIADGQVLRRRDNEVAFYRSVLIGLRPGSLVFDVGANHGSKTDIFLRLGARVVAIEPDEVSQKTLRSMFLRYRARKLPVTIVPVAISDKEGNETFWIDAPGSAKNTLSEKWVETLRTDPGRFGQRLQFGDQKKIVTTTLTRLMASHGVPFFIKIDVEGAEPQVLRGLDTPVHFLSFEVNLPEFREEGLACIERLICLQPGARFNYTADIQAGLALGQWISGREFSRSLPSCTEKSIEVFWNGR